MRLFLALVAAAFLLAGSSEAHSDGISVEDFGLAELIKRSQTAVLAEVGPRHAKTGAFKAKIKKVWIAGGATAVYKAGTTEIMKFVDENVAEAGKWVIVEQYWDNSGGHAIKDGAELVLFPSMNQKGAQVETVVLSTALVQRKLDLMFADKWQERYKKTPSPQLAADLADYDLYEEAYALLTKRRALRSKAVLDAAAQRAHHNILLYHLKKIGNRRGAFLVLAAKRSAKNGGYLVETLRRHFYSGEKLVSGDIKALTIYLGGLDLGNKAHVDICYYLNYPILRYLETKAGRKDANKFIPYFSRYIPNRSDGGGSEEHVWKFHGYLSKGQKAKLARGLMKAMESSAHGKVDDVSLKMFEQSVQHLPIHLSLSFLLAVHPKVDPDAFDGCNQVTSMIKATSVLAKVNVSPRSLKKLSQGLLPMYRCNVDRDIKSELERLAGIPAQR